jgi:hypothetical protein
LLVVLLLLLLLVVVLLLLLLLLLITLVVVLGVTVHSVVQTMTLLFQSRVLRISSKPLPM